jgi:hypothetical protein
MFNVNDNDDDIFDDTTTLSDENVNSFTSFTENNSNTSSSKDEKEFSQLIDNLRSADGMNFSDLSKMFITFYESCTSWIQHEYQTAFNKAVFTFNDHVIKGIAKPFPYYEKFFACQDRISKRRVVNLFLNEVMKDPSTMSKTAGKIGLDLNVQSINTYFGSYYNINQFAILEEFSHCKAISEYLNIDFDENVMNNIDENSVPGNQPYDFFLQHQFGTVVDDEFSSILSRALKDSIDRFVHIETDKNIKED